jgi:Putative transposase
LALSRPAASAQDGHWSEKPTRSTHLHCVVPAGGFDPSYSRWVLPKYPFFLPVKVLSRVLRGKFIDLLQRAPGQLRPDLSSTLVHTLLQHDWVVYAKPAFGGPTHVLRYLGRYTHRVAISNQRLLNFDGHSVRFRWKDYACGNKQRIMTLTAIEFLRRFCQHVLPRGFVRIRHFGYLASAHRTTLLALARLQLACQTQPNPRIANSQLATWRCPRCGANMNVGPNLTSQQLAFRCKLADSS